MAATKAIVEAIGVLELIFVAVFAMAVNSRGG